MPDVHLIAHNNGRVVYMEMIEDCRPEACRDWYEKRGYRVEVDGTDVHVHETPQSAAYRRSRNTIVEVMTNEYGW